MTKRATAPIKLTKGEELPIPLFVQSQRELAGALGVSVRTVRRWEAESGSPGRTAAGFNVGDWVAFYLSKVGGAGGDVAEKRAQAKLAREVALARVARVQADAAEKMVVPREQLERVRDERNSWICALLAGLPGAVASRCANKPVRTVRKILEAECQRAQRVAYGTRDPLPDEKGKP